MKFTKLTIALLSAATVFVSCNDDDDITEGRFDRAELYATSNTSGNITVYDLSDGDDPETNTFTVAGTQDNEGIVYDPSTDQVIFASRTTNSVHIGDNIEDMIDGTSKSLTVTASNAELSSPRSVAINGNFIVVANNVSNQLFIYERTGSNVTLRNTLQVGFALWEIQFDGDDLFAVVDNTNGIAVFNNLVTANTTNGLVEPTKTVFIEGIQRTHGFVYNAEDDIAIVTDIADATVFDDGSFHIITNFSTKFDAVTNLGTLPVAGNQVEVIGASTFLGNPVAAAYDAETNTIFIAENRNGGGRVLGFSASASGNASPIIDNALPRVSTVFFYGRD
ncbi:YncE family protein [Nonlabens agnitus]|uniref:Uncharacterized protein n=1 Tax=Nonlabens agnitus TaxID=870484 RepID=A0A2S9WU91_9FLAO|nr:hypothetical protein [Nonlabens agnitus]PRP67041.1 hypothetical protein BST86_07965 [Nonlabens agnitus]